MGYLPDWQKAKKEFETATGKKKPSETFLGVFRKSSGLEKVTKDLDDTKKKGDLEAMQKAMNAFEKGRQDYIRLLEKADAAEKNADYSKEIAKLKGALEKILVDFANDCATAKNPKLGVYLGIIDKNIAKIDLFLKDIDAFQKAQDKATLIKLATGDGGARGYCTACKFWDQELTKKMPEIVGKYYKGSAMKDFFPFAQEYGANHDQKWWDAKLNEKGDEQTALKQHAGWLVKHIPEIKKFRSYLQSVVGAIG